MKTSRLMTGLLLATLAAALAWATLAADAEDQARAATNVAARAIALTVEADLDRIERQVAWLLRPGGDATAAADAAFILATVPAVAGLQLVDGQGRVVYAASRAGVAGDAGKAAADTRAVLAADPERSWMSPVRRVGDRPHADLALMRHDDPRIAIADLDLVFFGDALDSSIPGLHAALDDEAGRRIAGTTSPGLTTNVPIPRADWVLRVTPVVSAWPVLRLAERFAAIGGLLAAGVYLCRRRVRQR